jgi:hypothetical protein
MELLTRRLFSLHLAFQTQISHGIPDYYGHAMLGIVWTAGTGTQYRAIGPTVRYYAGDVGSMTTTISRISEFPHL